jgi:Domain of unknown function (DUF4350)
MVTATLGPSRATGATGAAGESGPGLQPGGAGNRAVEPARQVAAQYWRRWRAPLAVIALVVIGGIAIAVINRLATSPRANAYLDPASSSVIGSHALRDVLAERGLTVVQTYNAPAAVAALGHEPLSAAPRQSRLGPTSATLVITSPYLLNDRQRRILARARADLFIVEPGSESLATLAPQVLVQRHQVTSYGRLLAPRCRLIAATLAGSANVGGYTYRAPPRSASCYPIGRFGSLVRYRVQGRTITIMGAGTAMMNAEFGAKGNAALVVNLLSAHRRIVWLTPEPRGALPSHLTPQGGPTLIPWAAWLIIIQLGVAVGLVAAWRARRMGPLITERLPVVVRASETVEGHGRLYQSRRARGRAAAALRQAMLDRVVPALGLAKTAPQEAVIAAIGARSRRSGPEISRIVYGPAPATDAELVRLARSLDELEREVRSQ